MVMKGLNTFREARNKAKERKSRSGAGFTRRLDLEIGEPVTVRPRGILALPEMHSPKDLRRMGMEALCDHAREIQAGINAETDQDGVIAAIENRYTEQEPKAGARHYMDRNRGKWKQGVSMYVNCMDPETALLGDGLRDSSCLACLARLDGDKGIGAPQATFYFSFWDYRKRHKITNGDDKSYEWCTMDEKGYCKHCSFNKKLGATEDERKKHDNYRPLYEVGMTYMTLPATATDQLEIAERRIQKVCRNCGMGKLKLIGLCCPHCEEEHDWDDTLSEGFNPDDPNATVACQHCGEVDVPERVWDCSKCDDPEPARLADVDLQITMSEGANGKGRSYSFTEELPVRPLDWEDPNDARILCTPLPDYEKICEVPSPEEMAKQIGAPPSRASSRDEPEDDDELPEAPVAGKKKGSPFGKKGSPFGKKGKGVKILKGKK